MLVFYFVRNRPWTSRSLKIGPIGCPETSLRNYHSTLRNIPENRRLMVLFEGRYEGMCEWTDLLSRSEPDNSWNKFLECSALSTLEWNMMF